MSKPRIINNFVIGILLLVLIIVCGPMLYNSFTETSAVAPVFNNNGSSDEDNIINSIEKLENSIVMITDGNSATTGLIINEDGYVLTTVPLNKKTHKVTLQDGKQLDYEIIKLKQPHVYDLHIIKIDPKHVTSHIIFGKSNDLKVGKSIYTMSNFYSKFASVTYGIISKKNISTRYNNNYISKMSLTDALIGDGSYGGVVFDSYGKALGTISGFHRFGETASGLGCIFDIDEVKKFLKANSVKYEE
jgi:S1-C subfamily serine protease